MTCGIVMIKIEDEFSFGSTFLGVLGNTLFHLLFPHPIFEPGIFWPRD